MTSARTAGGDHPYPDLVPERGIVRRVVATMPLPPSNEPFAGHGHLTATQQDRLVEIRGPHGNTGY